MWLALVIQNLLICHLYGTFLLSLITSSFLTFLIINKSASGSLSCLDLIRSEIIGGKKRKTNKQSIVKAIRKEVANKLRIFDRSPRQSEVQLGCWTSYSRSLREEKTKDFWRGESATGKGYFHTCQHRTILNSITQMKWPTLPTHFVPLFNSLVPPSHNYSSSSGLPNFYTLPSLTHLLFVFAHPYPLHFLSPAHMLLSPSRISPSLCLSAQIIITYYNFSLQLSPIP